MVDDGPDAGLFCKTVEFVFKSIVESAGQRNQRVAACGELAPILWARGNRDAAIEIELLVDEMCSTHGVDCMCAYISPMDDRDRHLHQFERICATHCTVHSS
jgi:hypothetical protein